MMTVFLVTRGEYSDHRVLAAYSTREQAERAADIYLGEVEEFPLDVMPDAPPGMLMWSVRMLRDGAVVSVERHEGDDGQYMYWSRDFAWEPRHYGMVSLYVQLWARDHAHAVKIVNERRAALIAADMWPPDGSDYNACKPYNDRLDQWARDNGLEDGA